MAFTMWAISWRAVPMASLRFLASFLWRGQRQGQTVRHQLSCRTKPHVPPAMHRDPTPRTSLWFGEESSAEGCRLLSQDARVQNQQERRGERIRLKMDRRKWERGENKQGKKRRSSSRQCQQWPDGAVASEGINQWAGVKQKRLFSPAPPLKTYLSAGQLTKVGGPPPILGTTVLMF